MRARYRNGTVPTGPQGDAGRVARPCSLLCRRVAAGLAATVSLAILFAPMSTADVTADLRSRVTSTRAAHGCPPLQSDPVLDELTVRNTAETEAYMLHVARHAPFENRLNKPLMQILQEIGYDSDRAFLLSGYGTNEADSITGLVLQGAEHFPDCAYTKYGAHALRNDREGYVLTAVILATP